MPGARRVDDGGNIGPQRRGAVAVLVSRGRSLELPANVNRDHLAAAVRQQVQDRQEVFLAAGIARDEQRGFPFAHPRDGSCLQRRERTTARMNRGAPYPAGQVKGGWCAHSAEPYLATLNKTSALAPRICRADGEIAGQEALRRPSS